MKGRVSTFLFCTVPMLHLLSLDFLKSLAFSAWARSHPDAQIEISDDAQSHAEVCSVPDQPEDYPQGSQPSNSPVASKPAQRASGTPARYYALGDSNAISRRHINPLDAMDVGAIRCFNLKLFANDHKNWPYEYGFLDAWSKGTLIDFIGPDKRKEKQNTLPELSIRKCDYTDKIWSPHFTQMSSSKALPLLVPCSSVICLTRYFAVAKPPNPVMRTIGSCGLLNQWIRRPPSFPLINIRSLLSVLKTFAGCLFFGEADQRLAYLNYPITGKDRQYFGVKMEGISGTMAFAALLMGWSWSPCLQAMVAKLLCHASSLTAKYSFSEGPGYFILREKAFGTKGKIVAVIIPFYDNFGVAAGTAELRDEICLAIANKGKKYGVLWKKNTPSDPDFRLSFNQGEFLGIRFWFEGETLKWCHCDKNIKKWCSAVVPEFPPIKVVASVCGELNWDAAVHLTSARKMTDLRRLQAKVSTEADKKGSWNARLNLSPQERSFLEKELKRIGKKQVSELKPLRIKSVRVLTSDASNWGRGSIRLKSRFQYRLLKKESWCTAMRNAPIHQRELFAATEAVFEDLAVDPIADDGTDGVTVYILFVDNTIAGSGLASGVINDDWSFEHLSVLEKWELMNIIVLPYLLPSEKMPADEPSRDEEIVSEKCTSAWDIANVIIDCELSKKIPRSL